MWHPYKPPAPGFVEPETGRVAVLVSEYVKSGLSGIAPAYFYSSANAETAFDPWVLIKRVEAHRFSENFSFYFDGSVNEIVVGPKMTIFVSPEHAAELNKSEVL